MTSRMLMAAVAAAALPLTGGLAQAQVPVERPLVLRVAPDVNPGPDAFRPVAGRRDAERAANAVGLADVDDAELDEGRWVVTGTDIDDRDMTVMVDARSGRVLKARYD
jgi:hypothetical protein